MGADNEEVMNALRELQQQICDAGKGGGCAEVRTLQRDFNVHVATQTAVNQRMKEVILDVYGNGKPGLKADMQDVRHDIRDLRDETRSGFEQVKTMITSEKEAREKENSAGEKNLEEKTITWRWFRETWSVPTVMLIVFFLIEYGLDKFFH